MENNNNQHDSKVGEIIIGVIVIALIAVGVSLLVSRDSNVSTTRTDDFTISTVNAASAEDADKLPEGFPASIPVEISDIEESYRVVYNEPSVVQHTVTYYSFLTHEEKVEEYREYMQFAGYEVEESVVEEANLTNLSGQAGFERMDVTVVPDGERTYVSVTYVIEG